MGIRCPGLTLKLIEFRDYKLSIQIYLGYLTKNVVALRTDLHKMLIVFQILSLLALSIYIALTMTVTHEEIYSGWCNILVN